MGKGSKGSSSTVSKSSAQTISPKIKTVSKTSSNSNNTTKVNPSSKSNKAPGKPTKAPGYSDLNKKRTTMLRELTHGSKGPISPDKLKNFLRANKPLYKKYMTDKKVANLDSKKGKDYVNSISNRISPTAKELLVDNQKARKNLNKSMEKWMQSKFGSNIQLKKGLRCHHVIPYDRRIRLHPFMIKAAKGGFNINSHENGVYLKKKVHHSHHIKYNAAVFKKLDKMYLEKPKISNVEAAKKVREYVKQMKPGLMKMNLKNRPLK